MGRRKTTTGAKAQLILQAYAALKGRSSTVVAKCVSSPAGGEAGALRFLSPLQQLENCSKGHAPFFASSCQRALKMLWGSFDGRLR
jgi:hypothetical protein